MVASFAAFLYVYKKPRNMKRIILFSAAISIAILLSAMNLIAPSDGWTKLFDGKTLDGWKVGENASTFSVEDGAIVVFGNRAHLFYDGPLKNHNFKNFEFKAKVMTFPGANSGMYIHTTYQETGWPEKGYEIQVNNSHTDWRRTGSVYAIQDVKEAPAKDNEWFTQHIIVQGKKITVKVNDKVINEYTEGEGGRLSSGTVALQGHDPKSKVLYKDIMVKPLPD
jgi:hypothetical protein